MDNVAEAADPALTAHLAGLLDEFLTLDGPVAAPPAAATPAATPAATSQGDTAPASPTAPSPTPSPPPPPTTAPSPPPPSPPPPTTTAAPPRVAVRPSPLGPAADTFARLFGPSFVQSSIGEVARQHEDSIEAAQRIAASLGRCNEALQEDFPAVQRDVTKCLILVDKIREDMAATQASIQRSQEILKLESLHSMPVLPP